MNQSICVTSPKCSNLSGRRLAESLGGAYIPAGIKENFTDFDVVFNYGSSSPVNANKIINRPEAVKICVNKISTLRRVEHGVPWTKNPDMALSWLKEDGYLVCRAKEEGSKSAGVEIIDDEKDFATTVAKFWTRYFPHEHEVRVNVFNDKILSVYDKVVKDGFFEFVHMDIDGQHKQVDEMIASIRKNIGVDYYGMDILVNADGKACLLEINSGPSLLDETEALLVPMIKAGM